MVKFYSTNCPKCKILEKKLKDFGIEYEEINDVDEMLKLGLMAAPNLEVDGEMMNFKKAVDWINAKNDDLK